MDVISLPLDLNDDDKIESRYRLVILAAQRARQIIEGGQPVMETRYAKATTIGLEEVLTRKVEFLTGNEAWVAQEEARRLKEEEMKSRALVEKEQEIAHEIKKDLGVYSTEKPPAGLIAQESQESAQGTEAQSEVEEKE